MDWQAVAEALKTGDESRLRAALSLEVDPARSLEVARRQLGLAYQDEVSTLEAALRRVIESGDHAAVARVSDRIIECGQQLKAALAREACA
jgi:hypothetical protein